MRTYIANCSFGKDSIATILLALENNEPLDRVIFSEVMFDHSRNISGELPEHIEWIYNTAIPRFESMGVKVCVVKSNKDYKYFFCKCRRGGEFKGLLYGFPIGKRCIINRECKVAPIKRYIKQFSDVVQYIGIAYDEKNGYHVLTVIKSHCLPSTNTPKQWLMNYAKNTIYYRLYINFRNAVVVGFV